MVGKVAADAAAAEVYREQASPALGETLETLGWYLQAGYLLPGRRHEVALRYGVISPDLPTDSDVIEVGVALSDYLRGHRAKVQGDLRRIEHRLTDRTDLELALTSQEVSGERLRR